MKDMHYVRRWSILALLTLSSCTNADRDRSSSRETVTDDHVRLPMEGGRDIMRAKLAHAHAILDAITLENWEQIALNADDLAALSEMAEWRVHTSPAYGTFSENFRQTVRQLARDARAESATAVADDFAEVTRACLACHTYLRREGLINDPPGRIASASDRHAAALSWPLGSEPSR
jgi:hypothetical protein